MNIYAYWVANYICIYSIVVKSSFSEYLKQIQNLISKICELVIAGQDRNLGEETRWIFLRNEEEMQIFKRNW